MKGKEKKILQQKILLWYKKNKRDFPWRKTKDPYAILISEMMLQQTQADRVVDYYKLFLKKFPSFQSLAKAKKKTLLRHWSGLGYNNRVLRLKELANSVVTEHKGRLPADEDALLALPGIGPYTAHAVLAFAFNKEVPVLDTNIRRVLIHELGLKESMPLDKLKEIALAAVPKGKSRLWHNALMDYGALVLTARKTGIKPLSMQGKFLGSARWVRGQVMKMLVRGEKVTIDSALRKFRRKDLYTILEKMEKDGLIKVTGNMVSID